MISFKHKLNNLKIFKIIAYLSFSLVFLGQVLGMEGARKNQKQNFFNKLPDELIIEIIKKLALTATSPNESLAIVVNLRLVDKRFDNLAQDNSIINELIKRWSKEQNESEDICLYVDKGARPVESARQRLPKAHLIYNWLRLLNSKKNSARRSQIAQHLLELFCSQDAEVLNEKDENGQPVVTVAVIDGNQEIVQELLNKQVDIDSEDNYKKKPLRWAVEKGDRKLYTILMENGAQDDFSSKNPARHCHPCIDCNPYICLKFPHVYCKDSKDCCNLIVLITAFYIIFSGVGAICLWAIIEHSNG